MDALPEVTLISLHLGAPSTLGFNLPPDEYDPLKARGITCISHLWVMIDVIRGNGAAADYYTGRQIRHVPV